MHYEEAIFEKVLETIQSINEEANSQVRIDGNVGRNCIGFLGSVPEEQEIEILAYTLYGWWLTHPVETVRSIFRILVGQVHSQSSGIVQDFCTANFDARKRMMVLEGDEEE